MNNKNISIYPNFTYTCPKCKKEQTEVHEIQGDFWKKYVYDFVKGGYYKWVEEWGGGDIFLECPNCGKDLTDMNEIEENMLGGTLNE